MGKNNLIWIMYLFIFVVLAMSVDSIPSPAVEFYGIVTINDTNATAGVVITVYDIGGTKCGEFTVVNEGYYGLLSCNGDDLGSGQDEGAIQDEEIAFYVDGKRAVAFGNDSWDSGVFQMVNLSQKNYPPFFLHNLSNFSINENTLFYYDINCSDLNVEDNLTYLVNTSMFTINDTTGVIDWIPQDADVGNYTIQVTCSDAEFNVSQNMSLEIIDVNNAPVLVPIGNQLALDGVLFYLDVDATDGDGDNLTYYENSTLFTINNLTGILSFTPTISDIGNYTINFSVTDGVAWTYELINLEIRRGPYCGDGSCNADEDCTTCSVDCGECPVSPGGPGGEGESGDGGEAGDDIGGGGGAGGASLGNQLYGGTGCIERWECTDWSACSIEGWKTRKCVDRNQCRTERNKPVEIVECDYGGTCFDNIKNQNEEGVDCGGVCEPCDELKSCSDGIKNNGEEGVDCGGPCKACEVRFDDIFPRLTPLAKQFPWWLLFIVMLLLLSTIVGDRVYLKNVKKKDFELYRERIKKYKRYRWYAYITSSVFSVLGITYIIYIYFTSDNPEMMIKYFWLPGLVVTLLFLGILFFVRYYLTNQKNRKKRVKGWYKGEQKRKKEISIKEDEIIVKLEKKVLLRITHMWMNKEFIKEVRGIFNEIFNLLTKIYKMRRRRLGELVIKKEVKDKIKDLSENKILIDLGKTYPEFSKIFKLLEKIQKGLDLKYVQEFLISFVEISEDKHLLTILEMSDASTDVYNNLTEVYESLRNELYHKVGNDDDMIEIESKYSSLIDGLAVKPEMGRIRGNANYISLYNTLVDIYNQYKRRKDRKIEEENDSRLRR